ncbi:hypothetical protein Micbo1qcDRAFT_141412 [Microdochium bolleyi]|uniref:Rhodopsin domain-containing protein n=1 Tax=Microdochium bolleyi TaxID=196109 RepID=A0A136IKQ4_9PEZI|nr:hypothetical protein Micbo1qcDRAFT_141412 [Microdochium bolleyi]
MSTNSTVAAIDPAYVAANNLPWLLAVTCTFHATAWIMVILRVYTRVVLVKSFGKDDALMVVALACNFGGGMMTLIMAGTYGWGRHSDTLTRDQNNNYMKMMVFHGIISSITAFMFIKLSIVFSLLRIQGHNKPYRSFLYGLSVFIILYTIVGWVSWGLSCYPLAGYWDKSVKAWCLPREKFSVFSYVNTVCNITTDFLLASLPIPLIWQLKMAVRSRVYLIGIFALGYLTCVLGILKVVFQFSPQHASPDRTFIDWVRFWGFLEGNMGIVVACAPTLKRLVGSWLKLGTTQKGSGYGYGGNSGAPPGNRSSYLSRNRDGLGGAGSSKNTQNRDRSGYIKTEDDRSSDLDGHELDNFRSGEVYRGGAPGEKKNDLQVTASAWDPAARTGSEEHILHGTIMRTTEVRVHPGEAK